MSKKIQINKRLKGLSRDELEKLDKNQLIDKIFQLEAYNFQLKNILQKKLDESTQNEGLKEELNSLIKTQTNTKTAESQTLDKPECKKRKFDFEK